jgi:GAF domain-containing protein
MKIPLPAHEEDRLAALYQYNILDSAPERAFDDLTLLAAHLCETPIAAITLVDMNRQWFKSKVGLAGTEIDREISFCSHTILTPDEILVVPDALADERFATNPMVTSEPEIRFYAGVPLVTKEGYALGALCVIDRKPRELSAEQLIALQALQRAVVAEIQLHRHVELLAQTLAERDQVQTELQSVKAELETKIEERTAELQAANEQLQLELTERERAEQILGQRVTERTAKLSAANAELARTARAKD